MDSNPKNLCCIHLKAEELKEKQCTFITTKKEHICDLECFYEQIISKQQLKAERISLVSQIKDIKLLYYCSLTEALSGEKSNQIPTMTDTKHHQSLKVMSH
ncbi:hypothetical protein STEG23_012077, partial [Scotinomys teguina]